MSNFRGRALSGLISRETGNYAWVGENGEYDIVFTVIDGDKTHKYYLHIIMNIPDNLPYWQKWTD